MFQPDDSYFVYLCLGIDFQVGVSSAWRCIFLFWLHQAVVCFHPLKFGQMVTIFSPQSTDINSLGLFRIRIELNGTANEAFVPSLCECVYTGNCQLSLLQYVVVCCWTLAAHNRHNVTNPIHCAAPTSKCEYAKGKFIAMANLNWP